MDLIQEDHLVEITKDEDWKFLDDLMEEELPKSAVLKGWLQVRRKWRDELQIPFHVCCPNGNVENGFVCYGLAGGFIRHVVLYQKNGKSWKELLETVKFSNKITWDERIQFGIPHDIYDEFIDIAKYKGFNIHDRNATKYYELPRETALSFDSKIPDDVYVDRLNKSHAEIMFNEWPHAFNGAKEYLECLITCNFGLGIFSKKDNSLPLSWCALYECGDIGVLQTRKEYQKKGYASILIKEMSKTLAEKGLPCYLYIIVGNETSEYVCTKLGYTPIGAYDWPDIELANNIELNNGNNCVNESENNESFPNRRCSLQ